MELWCAWIIKRGSSDKGDVEGNSVRSEKYVKKWRHCTYKPLFVLKQLFAFSFSGSFLSVFVFFVWCVCV